MWKGRYLIRVLLLHTKCILITLIILTFTQHSALFIYSDHVNAKNTECSISSDTNEKLKRTIQGTSTQNREANYAQHEEQNLVWYVIMSQGVEFMD